MKNPLKHFLAGLTLALAIAAPARAEQLSIEAYCQISVERLEWVEATWTRDRRAPSREEEETFLTEAGTTREAFYAFSGAHSRLISSYLSSHPELEEEIQRLADSIDRLMREAEGNQR